MERSRRIRSAVILEAALLFLMGVILWENGKLPQKSAVETTADGYIKWVDFNVSYEALSRAYEYDIGSYGEKQHLDWIDLLAYVGAKNGGDFGAGATEDMRTAAEKILCGEDTMEHMTADMKMFSYYREAYGAVLGGMVGEYEIQEKEDGSYVKKYGLKAFSPIAKGFEYSDYDDFGVSRSYGYQRQHLGHDMMGQVGTPIRTKSRKTLKSNVEMIAIENTGLYDGADQFVNFGITHGVHVVKQIAYPVIHKFFCLGGHSRPAVALLGGAKLLFKDRLFFVQSFQFSNDILCRGRIGAAGERIHQIPDGVGRFFQIRAHFAGINVRDVFLKFNAVRRQLNLF